MILLWGLLTDAPMAKVHEELSRLGVAFFFLDQRRTQEAELELFVDGSVSGRLRLGNEELLLETVTSAYFRPYNLDEVDTLEDVPRNSDKWRYLLRFERLLTTWLEIATIIVVNRPSAMATNNSKPYQAELIRRVGFRVPATLLTTSPSAVQHFWSEQERLIYKSISSIRSIVAELVLGDEARLANLTHCLTQFQQRIAGEDFRVHVLGEDIFACRIIAPEADYRYCREARVEAFDMPADIAAACVSLARSLDFHFTGIDLRRTPEDEWFCFEANPSPGFSYFASETGQPIASSLAKYLCRPSQSLD